MKIELFFKSSIQLGGVLDLILQRPKLSTHLNFNIPNKQRDENLLPFAAQIKTIIPQSNVCLHYSLKNNKAKGLSEATDKFINFISRAKGNGVDEILLVSGSGEKRAVNAVTCLQSLQRNQYTLPAEMQLSVAFNPYFSNLESYASEKERLLQKLDTGYVSLIYLQFGSNVDMLRQSLEWLDELRRSNAIPSTVKIYGSVFLPSKQLLARMKFRPWKGLLLTEEFLSDVPSAEAIVGDILLLYERYGVEVIVETAFQNHREAENMETLLRLK